MLDWVAKMLDLPEHFLNNHPGPGGGVIQVSYAILLVFFTGSVLHANFHLRQLPVTPLT